MFVYSPQREMGQQNGAWDWDGLWGMGMGMGGRVRWGHRWRKGRTLAYSPRQLNSIAAREGGHDDPVLHLAPVPPPDPSLFIYIYTYLPIPIPFPIFWGRKIEFVIVVEAGQFLDHMRHHHRVRRVQKT